MKKLLYLLALLPTLLFGQVAVSGHAADAGSNAPDAGGSVTSVGLALPVSVFTVTGSPVTGAGTLTGSFNTQTANTVFAGPTTGVDAVPAFRALVAADLPAGVATVAITDDTTTNATMYPTWVTAASGNLPIKVASTKFSFNPSTSTVTLADAGSVTSAGALSVTAGGVNKILTLSPSGTGYIFFNSNSGSGVMRLRNSSSSGYSAFDFQDSTGANIAEFGFGNSGVGAPYTSQLYFDINSGANGLMFTNGSAQILKLTYSGTAPTLTGGAGNMTITAGTGASRTLTLQTTTSGSAATTFLVGNADQSTTLSGKISSYNGITTAGNGVVAIVKATRVTAQSAANSSICTYTTPAADGSYEVSANMNVTASTTLTTTLTCTYTDESNTARSLILPVTGLTGSFVALGAISGAGASVWETPVMHIRCKASTVITILTSSGTFSGVTYTAEGIIKQMQ